LSPGSGVNKNLPAIGHINITGIVNVGGFMEIMILQNTRLSVVMNMASLIANGLKYNMWKMNRRALSDNSLINRQIASTASEDKFF